MQNSDDMVRGFRFLHEQVNEAVKSSLQSTSFLYALIDLLESKGVISIDELDQNKKEIAQRLVERHARSGLGLMYQDPEMDKYAFESTADVDCEKKLPQCKAVCCKLPFALSRQDVEEGIVKWEFGSPYAIAHREDGYCVHIDPETLRCNIHENRPVPCRGFNCLDSKRWRIWADAECTTLDSELHERIEIADQRCYHSMNRNHLRKEK